MPTTSSFYSVHVKSAQSLGRKLVLFAHVSCISTGNSVVCRRAFIRSDDSSIATFSRRTAVELNRQFLLPFRAVRYFNCFVLLLFFFNMDNYNDGEDWQAEPSPVKRNKCIIVYNYV